MCVFVGVWIYNKVPWKYTFNQRIANEPTNDRMNNRKYIYALPPHPYKKGNKLFILAYSMRVKKICGKSLTNFNVDEDMWREVSARICVKKDEEEEEEYQKCLRMFCMIFLRDLIWWYTDMHTESFLYHLLLLPQLWIPISEPESYFSLKIFSLSRPPSHKMNDIFQNKICNTAYISFLHSCVVVFTVWLTKFEFARLIMRFGVLDFCFWKLSKLWGNEFNPLFVVSWFLPGFSLASSLRFSVLLKIMFSFADEEFHGIRNISINTTLFKPH